MILSKRTTPGIPTSISPHNKICQLICTSELLQTFTRVSPGFNLSMYNINECKLVRNYTKSHTHLYNTTDSEYFMWYNKNFSEHYYHPFCSKFSLTTLQLFSRSHFNQKVGCVYTFFFHSFITCVFSSISTCLFYYCFYMSFWYCFYNVFDSASTCYLGSVFTLARYKNTRRSLPRITQRNTTKNTNKSTPKNKCKNTNKNAFRTTTQNHK